MSPSTVRGIKRPVQPDSPCARTSALACSYDTTAAIPATPSTASAVDHLTARSAAFTTHHHQPAETPPTATMGYLVQSPLGHAPTYMIEFGRSSAATRFSAG